jgi:glycosyltransferase involved in cell wall biosynthesis
MDIAFLIANQQTSHEGVVRPFFNFAKALGSKYEVCFLLINCSSEFAEYLKKSQFQVIIAPKNKKGMIEKLTNLNLKFIFVDDDLERLQFVQGVEKLIRAKTVCYIQILYGSHSIANCFDLSSLTLKQKLIFSSVKYVPFSFFSNRYAKLLRNFDLVVANSKVTANFLHTLYNVEVNGIIYPPVDTDVFQPRAQRVQNEVTLYLGSHLGDTRKDLVEKIIENVLQEGFIVNVFGNAKMASQIISAGKPSVLYHSNLTDLDLAKMYSRSKLTICPQKWEQFGLVPVESIACGTPVLAFNCMGFQETIGVETGWLANNEADFLLLLHSALGRNDLTFQELRNIAIKNFSIAASGRALQELLGKIL